MWIIDEEKYCREVFGYQTMADETFENYKKQIGKDAAV